ncbi:cysteine hydrolase family protein [Azorhizobium oxalatiphilum]|nr:isochorismatase family cysteine hydrolase [Azorhizobium oxalatiphilum]
MPRVLPLVERLVSARPERTIFTRFVPPKHPEEMPGRWRAYYQRWHAATLSEMDPRLVGLMPELERFVPPAKVVDKMTYSALGAPELMPLVTRSGCVIVSGAETDVCVLSSLMGLIDLGLRTIVVADAVCSSSDQGHEYLLTLFSERYALQVEVAEADDVIEAWRR